MSRILNMKPPRIAMGLLAITAGLWRLSPQGTLLHIHYRLIATVCVILGAVLNIWAWAAFKKAGTGTCATSEASSLVRTGIFDVTRNPMYLGMLLMLAGAAFFMGTIPSMFAPVAFFLVIDKIFIP